jgi:hypothetical protein
MDEYCHHAFNFWKGIVFNAGENSVKATKREELSSAPKDVCLILALPVDAGYLRDEDNAFTP